MKPKLSDEEKAKAKQRHNLKIIHNQILSAFSFKQLSSWHDVYKKLGLSEDKISNLANKDIKPTYQELKAFLENQKQELETKLSAAPTLEEIKEKFKKQLDIPAKPAKIETQHDFPFVQVTGEIAEEKNDCTVLALSSCLNISYKEAYEQLIGAGRGHNSGLRIDWFSEYLLHNGFDLSLSFVGIKLIDLLRFIPQDKYIVRTNTHAFTIKDGVVYDSQKPDSNIELQRVYKLNEVKRQAVVRALQAKEEAEKFDEKHNYGYTRDAFIKCNLFWHQKKATAELHDKIGKGYQGLLLLAGTGTGKTYDAGAIIEWLRAEKWHENKTFSHIEYLYLTKKTIVEQTERVLKKSFGLQPTVDVDVINVEQLRSSRGQFWVKEQLSIKQGTEVCEWVWKKGLHPALLIFDESQGGKNKDATQSKIIYAYTDLNAEKCLVCMSATPFTRVSEAQAFAVSTHKPIDRLGFPPGTLLTNETWPMYASIIASPSKPEEYNQAAVERLMEDLKEYVVRVKGVKPQFEADNGVELINFDSPEQKAFYDNVWERFEEETRKLKAAECRGENVGSCYLVVLLKFAMAAEFCHARNFARDMYKCVMEHGKASVAAVKFKQTLIEIVRILVDEYGVPRDKISLIWGGGQTQLSKKQKQKEKIKKMEDKLKEFGIELDEMLKDTGLDDVEDRVLIGEDIIERLNLGAQSADQRQEEIDKFQQGKSLYCIYTLKSGGVGLSLHHTDEWLPIKEQCRRKESGYVVEEDIPIVSAKYGLRERETFIVVTYNAIELVQGVGRVPRLTSLSKTKQRVRCFKGTIEVSMGAVYSKKLRCLSSVVKQREAWVDIIFGRKSKRSELVEEAIKKTENAPTDESSLIDEGDIDESDEDNNGNGN